MNPIPQPGIMEIALYQSGASHLPNVSDVLKLSANENPLGTPPSAQAAIAAAASHAHLYPSTDHAELRDAIGEVHGLDPANVICGVGSDEVLQFITQAFAGPGDVVLHTEHGFSMYPILARMAGATPVAVPEQDRTVDVDAILEGVSDATRVVMVTNPGNPTGTMIPTSELERLAYGLRDDVILVLDGAYVEYTEDYDGATALAGSRRNVLMTRTFSKIYGLGGLRIGWGYAHRDLIDVMTRIRQPFNLSHLQMSAAIAAVTDRLWVAKSRALNEAQRARLIGALRQLGVTCDESHTNFVLARFSDEAEALSAKAAFETDGILVRWAKGYGFPEALRITVGDEVQTGRVIAALIQWREGQP